MALIDALRARSTLAQVETLLRDDHGSPRDEPRAGDPRYREAALVLRAALSRTDLPPLWDALGTTLARMWPEHADEALAALLRAVAGEPANASYLYNLGLCHKYAGRFAEGVDANRRSLRLRPGDEAALWNLGICATGAGDGDAAQEAWSELGLDVIRSGSEALYRTSGGLCQIRVCARGPIAAPMEGAAEEYEFIWIRRLGPAHGVILSATLGDFFADAGDVVLHDGAALGFRDDGKRRVPRFPVLALLRKGELRSFRFAGAQEHRGELQELGDSIVPDCVYVHSEMVSFLCRTCARRGTTAHAHERKAPEQRIVYGKLVFPAAGLAGFRDKLDAALRGSGDLAIYCPELHAALGDAARAAADDTAWSALERN